MREILRTDVLPWLLGGLLAATGLATRAIASAAQVDPSPAGPAVTRSTAPEPAPAVVNDPARPAVVAQPPRRQALPPGQVWQCLTNGQRIFSDAPCGAGASIRQLNDVNRMQSQPVATYRRYPHPTAFAPAAADADDSGPVDDTYAAGQVAFLVERRNRGRAPRPHHHTHGASR
jgi:hypothetical protein